ncbi:MAG: CBS domain-containing protein [Cytophagales bacterium]|nr:CBS domain-containing protein [Bernardetiaceae bacterium]MDW8205624.1 CBS domain-containing protein [Cytophagales bacterium]
MDEGLALSPEERTPLGMCAKDFINTLVPPLKPSDTVGRALAWMEEFRVHQLPVVENSNYKGMFSETALYDANLPADTPLANLQPDFTDCFVTEDQHFYDVIRVAESFKVQTVPVLSNEQLFKGVVVLRDTLGALARTFATQNPGGIIVLSMPVYDYSLAQISRLIESNDAKILSSYVETDPHNPNMVKLTLKLSAMETSRIIATLERFGYHVAARFNENEEINIARERLSSLFKFLEN